MRRLIDTHNLIETGDHVILGLSGGPDSVCLLHLLAELRESLDFTLHAVHVNHMIRQKTAQRDEEFSRTTCKALCVDFSSTRVDCQGLARSLGVSAEEAGRMARYEYFKSVADGLDAEAERIKIAVAHNADDQAETLLFRLLRGTGPDGLAGMEVVRQEGDYKLIRPLLHKTRDEIEEYLAARGLEYVTDETNEEPIYARNKIRLELIPYIKENYSQNVVDALTRLADIAGRDKDFMWRQAEEAFEACRIAEMNNAVTLDREKLKALHPAVRSRVYMKALRQIGLWQDVSYERLEAADELLGGSSETKVLELPRGYRITFAFGEVKFKSAGEAGTTLDESLEAVEFDADEISRLTGVAAEALDGAIKVRPKGPGDRIELNGGSKTVRKLLGEMKVPADERELAMVAAIGQHVLYVRTAAGEKWRVAEKLRKTDKTKSIIIVNVV
ncbi:MAG: tRNA lysidine(34) synthetase TilS [Oscillospiraceae bacterium]|nr:tRNA lysidine(34) synthetase TilS [Oscillospiraceae bacterium]